MAAGVVTIGRRQYASGLYWENSPSGRVTQAAKEAARQPGHQADFFAVRPGNKTGRVPQFGLLSQAGEEHKAGLPVLAACIANQQPGSWVGAFRLREGVAVVVVRDDLIVPDGDVFFQDETEARDRLLQEMALGGLQRIYAPETWGVPGADTMPVSLLLNDRTEIKLRPVAVSKKNMIVVGGGVAVLALLLAIGWFIQDQNEKRAEEERLRIEAIERAKQAAMNNIPGMQQRPEYPPPIPVWQQKPEPMVILEACRVALTQVELSYAGWQLNSLSCSEGGLSVGWNRSGGFAAPPPKSSVPDDAGSASRSVAYPTLSPRRVEIEKDPKKASEELNVPEVLTRRYLAQNWTGTIARMPDDPPPPPPPNYNGEWSPPPPPWVKRSFTLTTPVLPWTLPAFFEGLPGVVVNSMTANGPEGINGSWTITGVIYEKRP